MPLTLKELREWPPEIADLAGSAREAAKNHTKSAEFYRSLMKASTWEGDGGDAARAGMEATARDHEATAENLGNGALGMEHAHKDAEGVARTINDILDHAAQQPVVEVNESTNQVVPPDTSHMTKEYAAQVATKAADLRAEIAAVLSAGELVDADLARAIATATGTPAPELNDGAPTPTSDGAVRRDDPARVRASAEAFEKVFGRLPTSPSDWSTAEALNPNSYDPKYQGVGPQIKVVKIKPVPGQGVVRASQYIEQRDVISGPGTRDFGNNRLATPNFDPEDTKVTTYIDYENGIVVLRQNPSVELNGDGGPGLVKIGTPEGRVWQNPDGAVRIQYDAANPFAPSVAKDPPWPAGDHSWTVNGDLVFTPEQGGIRVDGTRTDYPSFEVYQDLPNGTTRTVLIDPAASGAGWGPIANLPYHHDVGAGGSVFSPFDTGGWNPKYDVKVPLPPTSLGPVSSPPSIPIPSGPAQF